MFVNAANFSSRVFSRIAAIKLDSFLNALAKGRWQFRERKEPLLCSYRVWSYANSQSERPPARFPLFPPLSLPFSLSLSLSLHSSCSSLLPCHVFFKLKYCRRIERIHNSRLQRRQTSAIFGSTDRPAPPTMTILCQAFTSWRSTLWIGIPGVRPGGRECLRNSTCRAASDTDGTDFNFYFQNVAVTLFVRG